VPNIKIRLRRLQEWEICVEADSVEDGLDAVQKRIDEVTPAYMANELGSLDITDDRFETSGSEQIEDFWTPDYFVIGAERYGQGQLISWSALQKEISQ